jgi:Chaperone of endosialidase
MNRFTSKELYMMNGGQKLYIHKYGFGDIYEATAAEEETWKQEYIAETLMEIDTATNSIVLHCAIESLRFHQYQDLNALLISKINDANSSPVCIACNMTNTGVNDFITLSEAFQVTGNAFKTLGSGLWIFPSDRRLKTKIVSLNRNEMLSKINLMQGVNYELIANPEQGIQYGFIAQDLRKIFPTKVYENKVGYLSSSYGDFVPMFVEALKALNERVEKLEENKFDLKAITARVEEMEKSFK